MGPKGVLISECVQGFSSVAIFVLMSAEDPALIQKRERLCMDELSRLYYYYYYYYNYGITLFFCIYIYLQMALHS